MASLNDSVLQPMVDLTPVAFTNLAHATSGPINSVGGPFALVQVMSTVDAHIATPIRASYTTGQFATANSMPLPAKVPMVFKVPSGYAIDVIGDVTSGTMFLTIMG